MKKTLILCASSIFATLLLLPGCGVDDPESPAVEEMTWIKATDNAVDSTVYYVSMSGDDKAGGASEEQAFRSIARAFEKIQPGGEIRILPGEYNESLALENFGSTAATIRVVGWGEKPILSGRRQKPIGIWCQKGRNLVFENIIFQNYSDIGIGISSCEDVVLRDLVVRENGYAAQLTDWEIEGYGIHLEGSKNCLIENNDVYKNGPNPKKFPDRLMGTGIDTYGNRGCIIRNNHSHDNIGGGILVEDSFDILVEGNTIDGNDLDASADEWWDGGLWLDGGGDVTVRNNTFFNNKGPGIEISDEDHQSPKGYILENNESRQNYFGIFIWNFGTKDWPDSTVIKRSGNLFSDNTRRDVWIVDWY